MKPTNRSSNIHEYSTRHDTHLAQIVELTSELTSAMNHLENYRRGGVFIAEDKSTIYVTEGAEELEDRIKELTTDLRDIEVRAEKVAREATSLAVSTKEAAEIASTIDLPSNEDWRRAADMRVTMEARLKEASAQTLENELRGAALSEDPAKQYVVASLVKERLPKMNKAEDVLLVELGPKLDKLADTMLANLQHKSIKEAKKNAETLVAKAGELERLVYRSRANRGDAKTFQVDNTRYLGRKVPTVKVTI